MKGILKLAFASLLLATLVASPTAFAAGPEPIAQKNKNAVKNLSGTVMDGAENPLPNSVVYLKNLKSLAIKSYIADDHGVYHFYELSPNVDYQVYAEFNSQRSSTKTVSAFDSKTKVEFNLKIDVKK